MHTPKDNDVIDNILKMKNEIFAQDKIFSHIDKLNNWLDGELQTLVTVEIDPTNRCNSNCPGCAGGRNNMSDISPEILLDILEQLKDLKVKAITWTGGGEPLLNKHTLDAVTYSKKLGFDNGFITNGISLDTRAARMLAWNCAWVRVSLDAGTPEMYKQTHGGNAATFHTVLENIEGFVKERDKINPNCTLGTAYLTGKETVDGIYDFVEMSYNLGVDYAQLRPFHYDTTPIHDEVAKARAKFQNDGFRILASDHKYDVFDEKKRPYDKCYGSNFISSITADLDVTFCCHSRGNPAYTLGNLNTQSFREIWASDKRKELIEKINVHKCIPRCREDTMNRILWNIKRKKKHENFL